MEEQRSKISFCTVCLDDLVLLKRTLPDNIRHNEDCENLEFIILDCSHTGQLRQWLNETFAGGRISYHVFDNAGQYTYAHVKNIIANLASGNILCFLHPGQFTGPRFAAYINKEFSLHTNILLSTMPFELHEPTNDHPPGMMIGTLCVRKIDFMAVGGFNEKMIKPGNNDTELLQRLQAYGLNRKLVTDPAFCHYIDRKAGQGFSLFKGPGQLACIYISHVSPSVSTILFMYKDNHFEKGILTDQLTRFSDDYKILFRRNEFSYRYKFEGLEHRGKWTESVTEGTIRFGYNGVDSFILQSRYWCRYDQLVDSKTKNIFCRVTDPVLIEKLLIMNSVYYNSAILQKNVYNKEVDPGNKMNIL